MPESVWDQLQTAGLVEGTLLDYDTADNELVIGRVQTLEEIAASCRAGEPPSEEEEADEIDEIEDDPISNQQARASFDILRTYMQQNCGDAKLMEMCDSIGDYLHYEQNKKNKQTSLFDYFPRC
jgi:hypothetical protein